LESFADLIDRLAEFYGPLPLPPADPFGFYVWEILGTRTTGGRRDTAMSALRRIPALTPDSLRKLGRGRLEAVVRQCGPFVDERLSALDAGIDVFRRQPHFIERLRGPLRQAWLASRDLPHLGHAGALRLLLFTADSPILPVDAGMARLATRLGLAPPHANLRRLTRDVRKAFDKAVPREPSERRRAALYLHHHAEHSCVESLPHCGVCPLVGGCAEGQRTVSASSTPPVAGAGP
jgi:endonuclease III